MTRTHPSIDRCRRRCPQVHITTRHTISLQCRRKKERKTYACPIHRGIESWKYRASSMKAVDEEGETKRLSVQCASTFYNIQHTLTHSLTPHNTRQIKIIILCVVGCCSMYIIIRSYVVYSQVWKMNWRNIFIVRNSIHGNVSYFQKTVSRYVATISQT